MCQSLSECSAFYEGPQLAKAGRYYWASKSEGNPRRKVLPKEIAAEVAGTQPPLEQRESFAAALASQCFDGFLPLAQKGRQSWAATSLEMKVLPKEIAAEAAGRQDFFAGALASSSAVVLGSVNPLAPVCSSAKLLASAYPAAFPAPVSEASALVFFVHSAEQARLNERKRERRVSEGLHSHGKRRQG